jgi:hypothetical protein
MRIRIRFWIQLITLMRFRMRIRNFLCCGCRSGSGSGYQNDADPVPQYWPKGTWPYHVRRRMLPLLLLSLVVHIIFCSSNQVVPALFSPPFQTIRTTYMSQWLSSSFLISKALQKWDKVRNLWSRWGPLEMGIYCQRPNMEVNVRVSKRNSFKT